MYNMPRSRRRLPRGAAVTPPIGIVVPRADVERRLPQARMAGIALLVATAVVLVATLSKSWFTAGYGDGGVGVLGLESCRGSVCRSMTWFDVHRVPIQIPIFATATLIACLTLVGFVV